MVYVEFNQRLSDIEGTCHLFNCSENLSESVDKCVSSYGVSGYYVFNMSDMGKYGDISYLRTCFSNLRDIVMSMGISRVLIPISNYNIDGVNLCEIRKILFDLFYNSGVYIKVLKG